jgi:hypothetical protein
MQNFADCANSPEWECKTLSWNHLFIFCPGWLETDSTSDVVLTLASSKCCRRIFQFIFVIVNVRLFTQLLIDYTTSILRKTVSNLPLIEKLWSPGRRNLKSWVANKSSGNAGLEEGDIRKRIVFGTLNECEKRVNKHKLTWSNVRCQVHYQRKEVLYWPILTTRCMKNIGTDKEIPTVWTAGEHSGKGSKRGEQKALLLRGE